MTKREKVYSKFGGLCAYTGKPLNNDWQVDHIESKSMAEWRIYREYSDPDEIKTELKKVNAIENLLPACRIINHYKRSLDLEGFRRYMLKFHERLAKLPKNTKDPKTMKRKEYLYKVAELFDIAVDKPFSGVFYFESL